MLGNYFKPTSKRIQKVSLALKGFIGTVAGSSFFVGNKDAAFYFLIAGAFIDFILQCFDDDTVSVVKDNAGKITVLLVALSLSFLSCKTLQNGITTEKSDSTWTNYKPVDVKVVGASVSSGIDIDSLANAIKKRLVTAAQQGGSIDIDSLLNAALASFKEELKNTPPAVITDPESKVQLKYWYDQYGRLNMECSSKDQTIQMLVAELNRVSKEKTVQTVVDYVPVWYTWAFLGWAVFATFLSAIIFFIRK